MRYKIINQYDYNTVAETDNVKEAIKKLKQLEDKEYKSYLDYYQKCVDNFEDPTIDERPGEYYTTYYILDTSDNESYDITDYRILEHRSKTD